MQDVPASDPPEDRPAPPAPAGSPEPEPPRPALELSEEAPALELVEEAPALELAEAPLELAEAPLELAEAPLELAKALPGLKPALAALRQPEAARAPTKGGELVRDPDGIRQEIAARQLAEARVFLRMSAPLLLIMALLGCGLLALGQVGLGAAVLVVGVGGPFLGLSVVLLHQAQRLRLDQARALLQAGYRKEAIELLKPLLEAWEERVQDEATWLIALAYDQGGEARLAAESFRYYLRRHGRGAWAAEARVRQAELEEQARASTTPAARPPAAAVSARSAPRGDLRCPYCRDAIAGETLTADCGACGTPHHLRCYDEQDGCSVYGCRGRRVRTRVPEGG